MEKEKQVEQAFRKSVEKRGGLCLKFVSPGCAGVPDRIVVLPGNRIGFVELKAPGEKPRALQLRVHRWLRSRGCYVTVLDNKTDAERILDEIEEFYGREEKE